MKTALLKHPLTILAGVALGVLLGLCNASISEGLGIDSFANLIAIPGQLYLFYLQMTVLPIIITAIASSLGRLMRNKSSAGLIGKITVMFVICIVVTAIIGMILGMAGRPGAGLNETTRELLSKLISSADKDGISGSLEINLRSIQQVSSSSQGPSLVNFFRDLIPSNIFQALTSGSTMAIVFFSIIFGVAIGILKEESANLLISLLSAIFEAFQKIINWSLYLLPFGLVCLMAGQIAAVGPQIFMAMSKFIILYAVGTVVIFIAATVIMWFRSGITSPLRALSFLFEPILLSFATRNSMATLPSAITALDKKMGFNSNTVNLTLPLGMTLGRFGNIFYFALGTFFVAQIYNTPLGLMHYFIIFLGVVFGGTATAGASGIVTLSMISIILNPLGLPVEAVLVIFMAIDPIIDPFRTFLIVYVNMAVTSLVATHEGEQENPDGQDPAEFPAEVSAEQSGADAVEAEVEAAVADIREASGVAIKGEPLLGRVGEAEKLIVYIQEPRERPPILSREDGMLQGIEIDLLNEIARRLGRELVLEDGAVLDDETKMAMRQKADFLAGFIMKLGDAPPGFVFSKTWAAVTGHGAKKELCFLLPEGNTVAASIDGLIKTLNAERFLSRHHE
ncbi:MAG: cation:dicarboxylase symporter family transporter [Treponema sp.]|jgi:proton glutamate symport protein|nr:cation:dicarboxylase symporter family transporter [Treponema sp.]